MIKIIRKDFKEFILHPGTSCVMCFDNNDNMLLVQNNREIGFTYEIPGGIIESNESPIQTARREVLEETGYEIRDVEFMFKCYSSIGITDEVIYFHKAIIKEKICEGQQKNRFISTVELQEKIMSNQIMDFKTIISFLWYRLESAANRRYILLP
jgi:ADP-ribose pyrophosphatase